MRRLFYNTPDLESWPGSAIAGAAILIVAAALHFVGVTSSAAFGERAVRALVFSGMTFSAGAALGLLVWGGAWLAGGRYTTLAIKDTVLWAAALLGVLCVGLAVLS